MESRVRFLKHPLHPMLVMFPVALFPILVLLDVLDYLYPGAGLATAAFWLIAAGLASTLVAIVPGLVDMAAIPDGTKAHRTALHHAIVGFAILLLYAVGLWARWPVGSAPNFPLAAGVDALGLLAVSVQGWLGGQLVYHHHVGVKAREEGGDPTTLDHPGASKAKGRLPGRGASRP